MMKIPALEGCENDIEGTKQPMNEVLVMPYRFIEPTVFYQKVSGGLSGTAGYRIRCRHLHHSLLPFQNPRILREMELYFILPNGECKQVPLKDVFFKKSIDGKSLCFIPKK